MSNFNVSTSIMFWVPDQITIKEVISASKLEYFNLEGKTLASFEPGTEQHLEDFRNRLVISLDDGNFMEFVEG